MKSKYKLVLSMRHTAALFSPNAINGTQYLPSACRMESTERKERKTVCVDLRVELFIFQMKPAYELKSTKTVVMHMYELILEGKKAAEFKNRAIIEMDKQGISYQKLAEILGYSESTIKKFFCYRYWNRFLAADIEEFLMKG